MTSLGQVQPQVTVHVGGPYGGQVRVGDRFLVPRHAFVELKGHLGDPDVHAHVEWRDDSPQIVELTLTAKPNGRGLRSVDLDVLRPERLARLVLRDVSLEVNEEPGGATRTSLVDWSDPVNERDWWKVDGLLREAVASAGRGNGSGAELRQVADVYEAAKLKKANALNAVAVRLGISQRTAARRVAQARAAGLLAGASDLDGEGSK
jgi:hypothetical protein